MIAVVRRDDGRERWVTIKQHKKDTNARFRLLLDQLADDERVVTLKRLETFDYFVSGLPPAVLKKRIAATKQRERRRWGKKRD